MAFSKTLILLLPLFLLLATHKVVSQEDTTSFTFDSFSSSENSLTYQGDAFVPLSTSFVRLTKTNSSGAPMRNSIGRLVYSNPVTFWGPGQQASFETTIRFTVTPLAGQISNIGDGFNFFIVPVNSPIPPSSIDGDLGLFNPSTGLATSVFAVEFDIAPNRWDPNYHHIGIDINSRVSRNVSRFDNSIGEEVTARINYVSNTRTITVFATYGSRNSSVSYVFDLKTILPRQVQVGISATTGSWTAFHDLRSWYFTSTLVYDGISNCLGEPHIRQYV